MREPGWYNAAVTVTRDGIDHRYKSVTFKLLLWFNPDATPNWWVGGPGQCAALEKVIPDAVVDETSCEPATKDIL